MKVGLVQLNSTDETSINLKSMANYILKAKAENPEIIFFPENSLYFRINPDEKIKALNLHSSEIEHLKKICADNNTAIHFTSAIEDAGHVYNASVLIEKNKNVTLLYRKIHLFDIELRGQKPIKESDVFLHGRSPHVFEFSGFKFGSSICYDLRFAELYAQYAKKEVDVILVPAAFLVKTGKAHWEVLLRARAIESQCYVLAPAQTGVHKSTRCNLTRETFGHTLAINPWGQIIFEKEQGEGIEYVDLDKEEIVNTRLQIPMRDHRRIDLL